MKDPVDFKHVSQHEKPEKSPGFLLWHVSTAWRSAIEAVLKPLGLTHPQFVIIATLGWLTREGEVTTQAAVGKLAGLDPNTVSQILRGLEKKGIIVRLTGSDKRAKHPSLTKNGQTLLKKAIPLVEAEDERYFSSLSERQYSSLLSLFGKLAGSQ